MYCLYGKKQMQAPPNTLFNILSLLKVAYLTTIEHRKHLEIICIASKQIQTFRYISP